MVTVTQIIVFLEIHRALEFTFEVVESIEIMRGKSIG